MGDVRFDPSYHRVRDAADKTSVLREMSDAEIVHALAGASRASDPFLANVLATEAENRLRRAGVVAASAPNSILAVDLEGRITYVNLSTLALLGGDRSDLVGRLVWKAIEVFDLDDRRMARAERPSFKAMTEAREAKGEVLVRRHDGSRLRVVYLAAPILRNGQVDGAVVVFHPALVDRS